MSVMHPDFTLLPYPNPEVLQRTCTGCSNGLGRAAVPAKILRCRSCRRAFCTRLVRGVLLPCARLRGTMRCHCEYRRLEATKDCRCSSCTKLRSWQANTCGTSSPPATAAAHRKERVAVKRQSDLLSQVPKRARRVVPATGSQSPMVRVADDAESSLQLPLPNRLGLVWAEPMFPVPGVQILPPPRAGQASQTLPIVPSLHTPRPGGRLVSHRSQQEHEQPSATADANSMTVTAPPSTVSGGFELGLGPVTLPPWYRHHRPRQRIVAAAAKLTRGSCRVAGVSDHDRDLITEELLLIRSAHPGLQNGTLHSGHASDMDTSTGPPSSASSASASALYALKAAGWDEDAHPGWHGAGMVALASGIARRTVPKRITALPFDGTAMSFSE